MSPRATPQPVSPPFGGTWQVVTATPSNGNYVSASNPLLLTDGTVIVHDAYASDWWKLTPDNTGSYVNGSWTQIASLPVINGTEYGPQYFSSAVLPDGRVIIEGGEYNVSCPMNEDWVSLGAIYDPAADTWTPVSPPAAAAGRIR